MRYLLARHIGFLCFFALLAFLPLALCRAQEPKTETAAAASSDAPPGSEAKADEPAPAPAAPPSNADLKIMADTVWTLITGMLVFFMNLGFACVESGFCRAKNCVNILSKNFVVFAATSIGFLLLGFG